MRFLIPLAALAAIATPAAANTVAADEVVTVRIAYADIDVTTDTGRAELETRIEKQLKKACTLETNSRYGYGRDVIDEACVADARATAMAQVERAIASQTRAGREVAAN